jgi:hypothetical protein
MILVAAYLLRQKTRPTSEEAAALMEQHLLLHHGRELSHSMAPGVGQGQVRFSVSNVTNDRPIDEVFKNYILTSDGGFRYLGQPTKYEVVTYAFESGDPPEPTRLALVFARTAGEMQGAEAPPPGLAPFLERGARWEALGHWGDAALCYAIGLHVAGLNPELNLRLGRALTRFPRELGAAYQVLERVAEALPARADVQAALGRCMAAIADHDEIPLQGPSREDVRRMAIARLEAAARLDPGDTELAADLATQRAVSGGGTEESFYD